MRHYTSGQQPSMRNHAKKPGSRFADAVCAKICRFANCRMLSRYLRRKTVVRKYWVSRLCWRFEFDVHESLGAIRHWDLNDYEAQRHDPLFAVLTDKRNVKQLPASSPIPVSPPKTKPSVAQIECD